jgi:glyoxylase-like metal-dependent hydrolase (beta-lactamase superfamily II)
MMRRAIAVFSIAFATAVAAAGTPPIKSALVPIKVTERVYYVQGQPGLATAANEGFNSNAGFVITADGVVVIDALGTPALGDALLAAIGKVTPLPVKLVILTHYHADHFYGLGPMKKAGARIWAHSAAREYLVGGEGQARLVQRARDLFPWVDADMPLVHADTWLDGDISVRQGGVQFDIHHFGPAHSPEDLVIVVPSERVMFSGDILFTGRIPFVGNADSKAWLERIDRLIALRPTLMVTGHGEVSRNPQADLVLTRDYLTYLRETMGRAVEDFVPFDEAYAKADWKRFSGVPAFDAANRVNAYGTYLLMERESLQKK